MTHDLLRNVLTTLGVQLERVEITDLTDGVFHAALVLDNGARVDSRASDAIALAVRTGSPVLCSAEVVAVAGVEATTKPAEQEMERFRQFLDHVSPEDFDADDGEGERRRPAGAAACRPADGAPRGATSVSQAQVEGETRRCDTPVCVSRAAVVDWPWAPGLACRMTSEAFRATRGADARAGRAVHRLSAGATGFDLEDA